MDCLKLCGKCAFPQNFLAKKLNEISVFYAMTRSQTHVIQLKRNCEICCDKELNCEDIQLKVFYRLAVLENFLESTFSRAVF